MKAARKITQLTSLETDSARFSFVLALCDDGTLWQGCFDKFTIDGTKDGTNWTQVNTDEVTKRKD